MSVWDTYPSNYREKEVQTILTAIHAGESVSLLGLSGAGKSNLLGFLANRVPWEGQFVLVDGNRLPEPTPNALYQLIHQSLTHSIPTGDSYPVLASSLSHALKESPSGICLLFDRFDALVDHDARTAANNLRALRDTHKYRLTFVFATRRPLDPLTELAELVFANTLWLGPLTHEEVAWNVARYMVRKGLAWDKPTEMTIRSLSGGYPSFLRAVCEAHSSGCPLEVDTLRKHPAVARRLAEFWADEPTPEMITLSGLEDNPLLDFAQSDAYNDAHSEPFQRGFVHTILSPSKPQAKTWEFDPLQFSAKEQLLLEFLIANPDQVCDKDDVILAVWPEDKIYSEGVRDDSLAQLVRRVRLKIEPDPSNPRHLHTVPGRGYLFKP